MQIYLSYTSADAPLARQISDGLKREGFSVWDDREILPGDNWGSKVADALQNSDAMVVLMTPESLTSAQVQHDISYALGDRAYSGRLIPVVAQQLSIDDLPWILKTLQSVRLDKPEDVPSGISQITTALRRAA